MNEYESSISVVQCSALAQSQFPNIFFYFHHQVSAVRIDSFSRHLLGISGHPSLQSRIRQ